MFRINIMVSLWSERQDSNLRPNGPKRKSIGFLPLFSCFFVLFRPKPVLLRAAKSIFPT